MRSDYNEFCKKLDGESSEEAMGEIAGEMEHFSGRLDKATFSTSQVLRSKIREYQLIRQSKPIEDRLFEIEFLDPGVEAFVFTFG